MHGQTCLSADDLRQYAYCLSTEDQSLRIETHLEQCVACQSAFAEIVDSGAQPSFLRYGKILVIACEPTLAATTKQIKGESTSAMNPRRAIPDTIGHYRVTELIGEGGMGVVYAAWDELLKRPVALKLLRHHSDSSARSKRMLLEAAALGRLSHPNIVSIYELLSHESQPVLSMELVEGQNLAKWLEGRRVDPKSAAAFILKLAGGLHYAHSKGVVHRDLKPANIMLKFASTQSATLDDLSNVVPKISDFGLAKLVDVQAMTNTGDMLGTPAYMAPEQATGYSRASGPLVDVYALGVILYELLTGRTPFVAENTMQTLALVQTATPVSPRVHIASVPLDLETICLKCLEKLPADRYATVSALGDDLAAFLEGRPVAARPIGALVRGLRWTARNRILASLLTTCGMLVVAIITILIVNRSQNNTELASGAKSSKAALGWHGWPAKAPAPAIAPFNAVLAKQYQEAWAQYLKIDVEYTNTIGMKFRLIPPGEFTMGSTANEINESLTFVSGDQQWQECVESEAPQHKVILTQAIYLGVNEVTQSEYENVMGINPSHFAPMGAGNNAVIGLETGSYPVEMVSWNDAVEFCARLSKQEKLVGETISPLDDMPYRLPTEAQWECACRAGTNTKYWIGDRDEDLLRAGWFGNNCGGRPHTAGELQANPYGLHDIHGNIWEWVQDGWVADYYSEFTESPAVDPVDSTSDGSTCIMRGGAWGNVASSCRAGSRIASGPYSRTFGAGFRVSLAIHAVPRQ